MTSNKFYIWNLRLQANSTPIAWHPPEKNSAFQGDDCSEYFGKVLEVVQQNLTVDNLVFYFTRDIQKLPSYGDNVVAIVIGDEWSRVPKYFYKVRAVFKCYGINSILGFNLFQPSYLNFLTLLQVLKAKVANLPGWLIYLLHRARNPQHLPIYDIPLGYSNQEDLPIKPIHQRNYDVFFAGSIVHRPYSIWSPMYWFETPKSRSRKQMIFTIQRIQKTHPNLKVNLSITSGFSASYDDVNSSDKSSYSNKMMDAKICLVPRGTSFETFRFFEAMRYGCLIITESLPSRWFYDGSPAIQLKNWNELTKILETVIADDRFLQQKHQEALEWWEKKCSEVAVGQYIAEKLNTAVLESSPLQKKPARQIARS